jgi:hypothetical protein
LPIVTMALLFATPRTTGAKPFMLAGSMSSSV